jgi:hypothetical protein
VDAGAADEKSGRNGDQRKRYAIHHTTPSPEVLPRFKTIQAERFSHKPPADVVPGQDTTNLLDVNSSISMFCITFSIC